MKAIFVIDVDKDELGEAVATITANDITFFARGVIRPLPEQMLWGHTLDYIYGYNDCLEEITGEKE